MNCQRAQDWLLQADCPRRLEEAPAEVSGHVRTCADCQRLIARLERLERRWREEPLPASAAGARDAFLRRLPATPPAAVRLPRRTLPRWLMAAGVFLALGLGAWLLLPAPTVQASDDLVERLLDWNLDLSQAPSAADRARLYAERAPALEADLHKHGVPHGDREVAEKLLETAGWLAQHNDPVEEAERFNALADQFLERLHAATPHGDERLLARLARRYQRLAEQGLDRNLDRANAAASGGTDAERKQRLERVLQRDARRAEAIDKLLEQMPDASRKEIRQALRHQNRLDKQSQKKDRRQRSAAGGREKSRLTNLPGGR
jgi:hypothetical protein